MTEPRHLHRRALGEIFRKEIAFLFVENTGVRMKRTLTYLAIVLLTLTVANRGPGLVAPGPPLPGLGPGFEWIALFAIIVVAGAWLSRSRFATFFRTYDKRRSQAFEILRERYARGEISREEYLRIANDVDRHENVPEV
jgi:Short C-terminal domain